MNNIFKFLVLFFFSTVVHSQELLTVETAVKIALENNFQIKIASKALEIEKTGVNIGNAGMLPKVGATLNNNNSIQNSSQTRADGNSIELDNDKNKSLNYGVDLDWTLFDGFRMFARYDQLKELEKLGEAQLKQAILSQVSDVMIAYYDLVQQQQQLTALDSTLVISEQRLNLANNRFTIGKSSKLEVLNAKVDLNTDLTTILRQKELFANTKIRLNEILARDTKIDFKVIEEITLGEQLFLPELESLAQKQNPLLQEQIINKNIALLRLKQIGAGRYPTIVASTGYVYSESESSLGFTTSSNSRGWSYGFSARLNIFDGFAQNRNEQIAKIQIENTDLEIEQQKQTLQSQLGTTYQTYLTNISLIELERNNEAIAKENLEITMEKFRIGTIPTIEFRTAQLNHINAIVRYSNAKFLAKLSEISLKEFAGNLMF
ncbi:MAG: TolC family protein [Lutibacter sp.]|nr:TolC family protein [Lutibacter sp.]